MAESSKTVAYGITADASGFEKGMQTAASSAATAAQKIDGEFKKVQGAFSAVQNQILILASVVAGGAFFKQAIDASNELTGEVVKLQKALGISSQSASTLNVALKSIGSSADVYTDANAKLTKQIRTNEAGVKAMGVQTRGANGELLSGQAIMTNAITALKSYKEGTDRNLAAQTLFGRGAAEVTALLKLNNDVTEKAAIKARELGMVIGPEQAANTKAYKDGINQVKMVLEAIENQIGQAVMPAFTKLSEWFAEIGPTVIAIIRSAMLTFKDALGATIEVVVEFGKICGEVFSAAGAVVSTIAGTEMPGAMRLWQTAMETVKILFLEFKVVIVTVLTEIGTVIQVLVSDSQRAAGVIGAALRLDWNGITAAWQGGTERGVAMVAAGAATIKKLMQDTQAEINATLNPSQERLKPGANPPGSTGTRHYEDPNAGGGADKSRSGEWEAMLAEQKLAFQERMNLEGSFAQFGKQAERKFWQDKLAITVQGSVENITVRRKLADLQLAMGQEAYQHEIASLQTQEAAFKTNMVAKLALLEQHAATVRQRYGEESKEYEEVQKKIVEAKRTAIEQIKQIDMLRSDGERNANLVELQGREQIAQLERELGTITQQELLAKQHAFEAQKSAIQLDGLKERQRIALQDPDTNTVELERIHQEIQQSERQHQLKLSEIRNHSVKESQRYTMDAVNSMGSGFQRVFQQAMQGSLSLRGVMQGLWQSMAQAVSSALAKMAADWLLVQLKNLIFGKVVAQSSIAASAALAGAGGVASMAAAPWPLNMSAPAFGAAMMAASLSFAPLASASGGYDIPGTINPITQLHANEMVLPAKHADVIRSMADGGGAGGQGGGGAVNVHFNGGINDERTIRRFFSDNNAPLMDAIRKAQRDHK